MSDQAAAPAQPSLAQAWDDAAVGYHEYFVPRFAPWSAAAVAALPDSIPQGNIVVPCAGTGPEVQRLLKRYPQHSMLGVDLSAGMLKVASETCPSPRVSRCGELANERVSWLHADATVATLWPTPITALVSVFGLQHILDPLGATANWVARLEPGSTAVLCFWPAEVEQDGPFAWLHEVLRPREAPRNAEWEAALAPHLETCGAELILDAPLSFNMQHPGAEALWDAMLYSGPLARLRLAVEPAELADLKRTFLDRAPRGSLSHEPQARCIVLRTALL